MPVKPERAERVWTRFTRTADGCWQWTSYIDRRGYGRYRSRSAHRTVYEFLVGPIPESLTLDHLCRNRACVNPAHLEPVTARVNILRGFNPAAQNARKTHCVHGHPLSGSNLRFNPAGHRVCVECERLAGQRKRKTAA